MRSSDSCCAIVVPTRCLTSPGPRRLERCSSRGHIAPVEHIPALTTRPYHAPHPCPCPDRTGESFLIVVDGARPG